MEIQIIILTLLFSAFFSGIEIAFVSSNKLKIELRNKKGSLQGRILANFMETPSHFLGTTLIGNNLALIFFGIMMARLLEPPIIHYLETYNIHTEFLVLLIQTIVSTGLLLLVSEFIPKVLFRINPNGILNILAIPIQVIYFILYPFVWFIVKLSYFIMHKIMRINYEETKPVFTKIDLEHFIKQSATNEDEEYDLNKEIFEKALYLINVRVRECMVPRPEIEAVEVNSSIADLRQKFIETKLSKVLVYEESIDNVLGYVHHYELFKKPENIRDVVYKIPVVPESMKARDVLNIFIREHKSIAWVVDEFGGTAGIITLEDVLEEIFGEIQDEFDEEEFIERQISHNEYIFSGRLEIDYINEKYKLELPEGEYETIAGYIVAEHEKIPEMNEELVIGKYQFTILNVSDTRIETVKLRLVESD